jgi:hypothetical protein
MGKLLPRKTGRWLKYEMRKTDTVVEKTGCWKK